MRFVSNRKFYVKIVRRRNLLGSSSWCEKFGEVALPFVEKGKTS